MDCPIHIYWESVGVIMSFLPSGMEWQTILEPLRTKKERVMTRAANTNMDLGSTVKIQCTSYGKVTVGWPHWLDVSTPWSHPSLILSEQLQSGKSDHSLWNLKPSIENNHHLMWTKRRSPRLHTLLSNSMLTLPPEGLALPRISWISH